MVVTLLEETCCGAVWSRLDSGSWGLKPEAVGGVIQGGQRWEDSAFKSK